MRLRPIDPWETSALRLAVEAACVAALVAFVLWPFRLYGFDLVDEGTQLAQIERAAAGERPYVDFETGYTPGYFALGARLLEAGGGTIEAIRTFGIVWQCVLVAGLWATVRAWGGLGLASAIAMLYVAFVLPVSLRTGAPFNIPYPGWLTAPAALAVQVMVARVSARRIRRRSTVVAACGVVAGLAFSVKPNVGLLVLAGATLALAPVWSPASAANRLFAGGLRLIAVVATVGLLAPGLGQGYVALLLPVVFAAYRARPSFEDGDSAARHAGLLACGFGLVVVPWLAPLVAEFGFLGVLRTVFLLDGGVVSAYLLPFEAPSWSTLALAIGAVAAYASRERPARLPLIAVTTLVVAAVGGAATGPRLASENVLLWLGPLVVVFGLADREALDRWPRERAALLFLAVFSLQLFPRPDSFHVSMGAAPLALGAALVWRRHARRWRLGSDAQAAMATWAPRVAIATVIVLSLGRALPAWLPAVLEPRVDAGLGPRAPVEVVERYVDHYQRTAWLVSEVQTRTEPGEAIFAFPDLAGVGYLAGRSQPHHYLYFVPGRPDAAGEQKALEQLERVAPDTVVTCPPQVPAFVDAPAYFARLGDAVRRTYAPAVDVDGCIVWTRRSTAE